MICCHRPFQVRPTFVANRVIFLQPSCSFLLRRSNCPPYIFVVYSAKIYANYITIKITKIGDKLNSKTYTADAQ